MMSNAPIWISENLAVGPALSEDEIRRLPGLDIRAVVDMRSEYTDDKKLLFSLGIEFLHVSVDDTYAPSFGQIEEIWKFVSEQWRKNNKVYIHCQNGYGRSPLACICILAKSGWATTKALYHVEDRHPWAIFTDHQQKFLYEFEKKQKGLGYNSSGS